MPLKPAKTFFNLPDGKTEVWIDTTRKRNGPGNDYSVGSGDRTLARWMTNGTLTRVSPAMVNDDRAQSSEVFHLQLLALDEDDTNSTFTPHGQDSDLTLAWAAVYALWLHSDLRLEDVIAVSSHSERISEYMKCTGLGVLSPFSPIAGTVESSTKDTVFWLHREAFWQGAGAPDSQHWLRCRPEVTSFPGFNGILGVFASQLGFTHRGNVCTVHPVRPPKPQPGTVIYSRFIVELGQQLQILHIDAENPVHFDAYKRWQNSDRVNASWHERGSDQHHRNYLAEQLADPHSMSCLFKWGGELAGYTELGWVKEDNAACFFGSNCNIVVGEHDQNSHILVGEEHLRGGKRYQAVATSIKHCCFLRDPRTRQIIAEPRFDLAHVHIQNRFLPQEKKKRFHLPHKTAMLFALQRDRFFQEAHFL
jgi:hypothetical protein